MTRLPLRPLILLPLILAASCGIIQGIETLLVGSQEAVQATTDAAKQAESTLNAIEQVVLIGGSYLLGELRRPMWGKFKNGREKRKSK